MEYVLLFLLILISYFIGRVLAPFIIYIFRLISNKTKNTLDDYILKEIEAPLESVFFIFLMYLFPKYIDFFSFSDELVNKYIVSAIFISITFFGIKIIKAFFNWYYDDGHKNGLMKVDLTLLPFMQKFFQIIIGIIGLIFAFNELGFNMSGVIAITSLTGIILGLASQETLANLFAGLALQLDRPFKYGDLIRLPSGEIVKLRKIGIRSSKLYDQYSNTVIISNSEFAKQRVNVIGNENNGFKASIFFEAPIFIKPAELENYFSNVIEKKNIVGLKNPSEIKIYIMKIKTPGWYEAFLEINVEKLSNIPNITTEINSMLIEKINSMQNKRKK